VNFGHHPLKKKEIKAKENLSESFFFIVMDLEHAIDHKRLEQHWKSLCAATTFLTK